jgi:hypothetical protein
VTTTTVSASCVHCGQSLVERACAIAKAEIDRVQEHLLGCPAAIAACAPALPLFDHRSDILQHIRIEQLNV